jgi:D-amino-acid oxidase
MDALVLGAGVIGLTTALVLAGQGWNVELWSKEFSPHTTSDVAAAFWYPYEAYPIEKVTAWATQSYENFKKLQIDSASGIRPRKLVHYFQSEVVTPGWSGIVHNYAETSVDSVAGYKSAFSFDTFVIDMTIYMPYLVRRCAEAGVKCTQREVKEIGDISDDFKLIINCTGLGSKDLFGDDELYPAKGQVVRIPLVPTQLQNLASNKAPNGELNEDCIVLCDSDLEQFKMIVPRTADVVLGGTYQHTSDLSVDPAETERIIRDCKQLVPSRFRNNEKQVILGSASGLRPSRHTVRLELQNCANGRRIIHNYGHGGAGVTLSWGCAENVAALAH